MRNAWAMLALACAGCGRALVDASGAEARHEAVRAASGLALEGARPVRAILHQEAPGDRSRAGPRISHSIVHLRQFDWSHVDVAGCPGGPAGALLAQAAMHEEALRTVGLFPVRGLGTNHGMEGEPPHPRHERVKVVQRGRGGGGGYFFDLDAPRLTYHRVYCGSLSGAVLFTRLEYDQALRRLEVEFSYADSTILGQPYREARDELDEAVAIE